ncbi:MAG: hypothetical protein ACRENL_00435 [Candidatus Dormibacteria bacterium]
MHQVRLLAMDHFFDQDLRALESHPELDVRRFPYQRLRGPALRLMGQAVANWLEAYTDPHLERARRRYAAWVEREVQRLYLERAFDVLVLPSDTFFYVRSLVDGAHLLGLPTVVVQKETTISPDAMAVHSQSIRASAPFIADFMTVCSGRHREFWMHAGADGDRIEVTGQPRFDLYATPRPRTPSARTRVLFLTYELDAYVGGVRDDATTTTWKLLRDGTEEVLLAGVSTGACEVVVKCHPQQNHRIEASRLARFAGVAWNRGLSLADADADTRELIMAADVVVGFQTTALYEAVAARRMAVYAAWGADYRRFRDGLIRFDEAPSECVRQATSPEQLAKFVLGDMTPRAGGCEEWYEEALGPIDGHATDRVAARLRAIAEAWPMTAARRELDRRRLRFAAGLLGRSAAAEALWTAAIPAANVAGEKRRVAARRIRAREGRTLALAALLHREPTSGASSAARGSD